MDSNRASQEQDQQPDQEEPESFPGLLSAEERDNSLQIEVSVESRPGCDATVQTPFFIFNDGFYLNMAELKKDAMNHRWKYLYKVEKPPHMYERKRLFFFSGPVQRKIESLTSSTFLQSNLQM